MEGEDGSDGKAKPQTALQLGTRSYYKRRKQGTDARAGWRAQALLRSSHDSAPTNSCHSLHFSKRNQKRKTKQNPKPPAIYLKLLYSSLASNWRFHKHWGGQTQQGHRTAEACWVRACNPICFWGAEGKRQAGLGEGCHGQFLGGPSKSTKEPTLNHQQSCLSAVLWPGHTQKRTLQRQGLEKQQGT